VSVFETELPTNQTVHVRLVYTGSDQSAALTLTTNGLLLRELPPLVLSDPGNSQFTSTDSFEVDTFSISSYSSIGDDYDSVLAHGTVDNLAIAAQLQPISRLTGAPGTNGLWQARFFAHRDWLYTLERSANLRSWAPASSTNAGNEDFMVLEDADSALPTAFYRVRAQTP
jgi:hypothetical protein